MIVFDKYAEIYDDYYSNKNYEGEVDFILSLAEHHGLSNLKAVLDMGCGTGGHIVPFAQKGVKVTGFDLSEGMIQRAQEKIEKLGLDANATTADARTYRDGHKYDLVIAMFAVMGYLTSNEDLCAGLKTAKSHLRENGLFIFDVWSGSAVLHQLPETRIQEFKQNGLRTIRLVVPELNVVEQLVKVNYSIFQFNGSRIVSEVKESHKMRYFFIQELAYFLKTAGLELVNVVPFMQTFRQPTLHDWNIAVVAKCK